MIILLPRLGLFAVTSWLALIGLGLAWCSSHPGESKLAKLSTAAHSLEANMRTLSPENSGDSKALHRRGVSASVKLERRKFNYGDPIVASFEIKNGSAEPITLWLSGFWLNHCVVVRDQTGVEPRLTPMGQERREAFQPNGPRRKNIPLAIKPSKSYQSDLNLNLNDLYRLEPGIYKVEITYDDQQPPTPLRVTSPAVPFEIKLSGPDRLSEKHR